MRIMRKICKIKFPKTEKTSNLEATMLKPHKVWSSIKPGTWNIPEHSGISRNIPEHRIIMTKICKIKFSKTEKTSNLEAAKLKLNKCYHFMIL